MTKEKQIQDELDKYWGQQDRIEKYMKWLIIRDLMGIEECENSCFSHEYNRLEDLLPDISDILEEK